MKVHLSSQMYCCYCTVLLNVVCLACWGPGDGNELLVWSLMLTLSSSICLVHFTNEWIQNISSFNVWHLQYKYSPYDDTFDYDYILVIIVNGHILELVSVVDGKEKLWRNQISINKQMELLKKKYKGLN